jgi:hypothetical protein
MAGSTNCCFIWKWLGFINCALQGIGRKTTWRRTFHFRPRTFSLHGKFQLAALQLDESYGHFELPSWDVILSIRCTACCTLTGAWLYLGANPCGTFVGGSTLKKLRKVLVDSRQAKSWLMQDRQSLGRFETKANLSVAQLEHCKFTLAPIL